MGRRVGVALDKQLITEAAVKIIEKEGWNALSLRRLASDLDVYPNTITWHLSQAGATLEAWISEYVLTRRSSTVDKRDSWQAQLKHIFLARRAEVSEHPELHQRLIMGVDGNGDPNLPWVSELFELFKLAGIPDGEVIDVANAFIGALEGYLAMEFKPRSNPGREFAQSASIYETEQGFKVEMDKVFMLRSSSSGESLEGGYLATLDALIAMVEHRVG